MVRKGYKQTEIGMIPDDWKLKIIGDIGSVSSGGTPSRTNFSYWNGTIPWITTTQIDFNTINSAEQFITKDGLNNSAAKLFPPGTLLMAMYGQGKTRGKVAILGVKASTNQACAAILLSDNVHQKYVFYYLASQYEVIRDLSNIGNQENLNGLIIKSIKIPLPPIKEQRSLTQALSDVDALITALDKLIAKKRNLKTATMQQLLTGKKRLPGFVEKWQTKLFSEIASCRKDRLDPRKSNTQEFCVELEHIESGTGRLLGSTQTGEQSSLKALFQPSDVLFGRLRSYLRKYWFADCKGVCSTEIWILVANSQLVTPKFLYQVVTVERFIEAASTAYGTHMPRADWNVVKNYEVAVPTIKEQHAIATVLSDMDAEIVALETRLAKTQAIKQGMMQELLTGRISLKIET